MVLNTFSNDSDDFVRQVSEMVIPNLPQYPYEISRLMHDVLLEVQARIKGGDFPKMKPQGYVKAILVKAKVQTDDLDAGLKKVEQLPQDHPEVVVLNTVKGLLSLVKKRTYLRYSTPKNPKEEPAPVAPHISPEIAAKIVAEDDARLKEEKILAFKEEHRGMLEAIKKLQDDDNIKTLSGTQISALLSLLPSTHPNYEFAWDVLELVGITKAEIKRLNKVWKPVVGDKREESKKKRLSVKRIRIGEATKIDKAIPQHLGIEK